MSDKNLASKVTDITKKIINKAAQFKNIIFYAVFIFIIIAISIVFSESYRVNKCVKQMDIYKEFIVLNWLNCEIPITIASPFTKPSITGSGTILINLPSLNIPAINCNIPIKTTVANRYWAP